MIKLIDEYKKLPETIHATSLLLICSFLQKGISVITTPIFTRLMSTEEFGQYNVIMSWLGIITILVTFQVSLDYCSQAIVKYFEDKSRFLASIQGLLTTLICIAYIIYFLFRTFWNAVLSMNTVEAVCVLSMAFTTSIFNCWSAEKRTEYSYKSLTVVTIITSLAKPILGIVLVSNCEDKVEARIVGLALVELTTYFGIYISQFCKGKSFYIKKYWKDALAFSVPLIPHFLSQIILASSDKIMIQNLIGESEAGIYSLAYSIGQTVQAFSTALLLAISPWIYQKIKMKNIIAVGRVVYISLASMSLANVLVSAFTPEIVNIFAPNDYYGAIWVVPSVAASVLVQLLYGVTVLVLMYYSKTLVVTVASMVASLINVGLNYWLIPQLGYYAAGYTTVISYICQAVILYFGMKSVCDECLDGRYLYDIKVVVIIMLLSFTTEAAFTLSYLYTLLRIILILALITGMFVFRSKIKESVKMIMKLKQ